MMILGMVQTRNGHELAREDVLQLADPGAGDEDALQELAVIRGEMEHDFEGELLVVRYG